jgi:hypothetical protein
LARLAIDKDFLDDYSKLPKAVQSSVKTAIDKFAEHVYSGLHLEKLNHSKDDRIRTIRIDQFWRGVVLAPASIVQASRGPVTDCVGIRFLASCPFPFGAVGAHVAGGVRCHRLRPRRGGPPSVSLW